MVVSEDAIAWDFPRWRRTLESYRIDGRPVLELSRSEDSAVLDGLISWQASLAPQTPRNGAQPIEPCPEILARTAGKQPVTDDNMGSEWRYPLGFE